MCIYMYVFFVGSGFCLNYNYSNQPTIAQKQPETTAYQIEVAVYK